MAHTSMLAAFFLLVTCALASAQGSSCPVNFFMMGSHCVFVTHDDGNSYSTYVDWSSARKNCAAKVDGTSWTADLVSNFDATFQRLLNKYITATTELKESHVYYVGIKYANRQWQWLDGTAIDNRDYIWSILAPVDVGLNYMTAVLSLPANVATERMTLSIYPTYVRSPHYVCEAKPVA